MFLKVHSMVSLRFKMLILQIHVNVILQSVTLWIALTKENCIIGRPVQSNLEPFARDNIHCHNA